MNNFVNWCLNESFIFKKEEKKMRLPYDNRDHLGMYFFGGKLEENSPTSSGGWLFVSQITCEINW